eukprot:3050339-Pleurochrysis_carterae.AAC.1
MRADEIDGNGDDDDAADDDDADDDADVVAAASGFGARVVGERLLAPLVTRLLVAIGCLRSSLSRAEDGTAPLLHGTVEGSSERVAGKDSSGADGGVRAAAGGGGGADGAAAVAGASAQGGGLTSVDDAELSRRKAVVLGHLRSIAEERAIEEGVGLDVWLDEKDAH